MLTNVQKMQPTPVRRLPLGNSRRGRYTDPHDQNSHRLCGLAVAGLLFTSSGGRRGRQPPGHQADRPERNTKNEMIPSLAVLNSKGATLGNKLTLVGVQRRLAAMARHVPIAGPFPNVADHVVKTIAVRRKAADRRSAGISVLLAIIDGKDALPGIGNRLAVLVVGVAPILPASASAARRIFPCASVGRSRPRQCASASASS